MMITPAPSDISLPPVATVDISWMVDDALSVLSTPCPKTRVKS